MDSSNSSSSASSAPVTQSELNRQLLDAINMGHSELVEKLITAGADININAVDQCGETALMIAATNGETDIVTALIEVRADVNAVGMFNHTALIYASKRGHTATVSVLLARADININAVNIFGETALMCASKIGHTATVSALLARADININAVDQCGETALMIASRKNHRETAFRLLNAMTPQEITATHPSPSFLRNTILRQPIAITPIEAAYNLAMSNLRQSLSSMVGAFNTGPSRHGLSEIDALLNIIAGYYSPEWCKNVNQEMSHALTERRRPVILSRTSRVMNRLHSVAANLTSIATRTIFGATEEEVGKAKKGPSKKPRHD